MSIIVLKCPKNQKLSKNIKKNTAIPFAPISKSQLWTFKDIIQLGHYIPSNPLAESVKLLDHPWLLDVMVSIPDFDSGDLGSIPGVM